MKLLCVNNDSFNVSLSLNEITNIFLWHNYPEWIVNARFDPATRCSSSCSNKEIHFSLGKLMSKISSSAHIKELRQFCILIPGSHQSHEEKLCWLYTPFALSPLFFVGVPQFPFFLLNYEIFSCSTVKKMQKECSRFFGMKSCATMQIKF